MPNEKYTSPQLWMFSRWCILFVFSLTLGLACGELPESFRLTDDVSNDFVEESSPVSESTEIAPADLIGQHGNAQAEESIRESVPEPARAISSIASPPALSPNLLRLLSIQRK